MQVALGGKTENICTQWAPAPPQTPLKLVPSDLTAADLALEPLSPLRSYAPMPAKVDLARGYSTLYSHSLNASDNASDSRAW